MKKLLALGCLLMLLAGCQPAGEEPLVVYSGRSQALIEELVERFEQETGTPVEVRYGTDAQLIAALQEEGDQSEADVFWANTVGALSAAINAGFLTELPDSVLQRPAAYVPSSGLWTPVTVRYRVLAYNTDQVQREDLPASVMDLPDLEQYEGRIGWTPTYSSFQDFVTAMRLVHGQDAARAWLEEMQALDPEAYSSNTPLVRALGAGEIDLALTNHYYVLRLKHGGPEGEYEGYEETGPLPEGSPNAPVETYRFERGDVGNLALVTGAGVLVSSEQQEAAHRFLRFLLSPEAQAYAAQSVHEYPIIETVELPGYMLPADSALAMSPEVDFGNLEDLNQTLELMREVGLL